MVGTTMTWNQIGEPISLITRAEQATLSYLVETKSQKFNIIDWLIQKKDAICFHVWYTQVRSHMLICEIF